MQLLKAVDFSSKIRYTAHKRHVPDGLKASNRQVTLWKSTRNFTSRQHTAYPTFRRAISAPSTRALLPGAPCVSGERAEPSGWVMDFGDIKGAFKPSMISWIITTSTTSAAWKTPPAKISRAGSGSAETQPARLSRVEIRETCTSGCVYTGD